jgi:hypothetical protein
MRVVFATATTTVALSSGISVSVNEGSHWSDEDAVVRSHPDLFSADPRYGMLFSRPLQPEDYPGAEVTVRPRSVEQTTARPGERRDVRRG